VNALDIPLTGKVVVFRDGALLPEYPPLDHLFLVVGGFGAQPYTMGSALSGVFLSDGEQTRMEGDNVARLANPEEIARMPLAHLVPTD